MTVNQVKLSRVKAGSSIIQPLTDSEEPSIRFRVLTELLGAPAGSVQARSAQEYVRTSERVARLLAERRPDGRLPYHPYAKWVGAHWVLVALAELGYPPKDRELLPLREQVFDWLLGQGHLDSIRTIRGRVRIHASQEGNALYSQLALGLADERTEQLALRLQASQWPDGGWNCDRNPSASNSSFMETLIPLRGLALDAKLTGNHESGRAAEQASEVFLKRHLFKRRRDGAPIHEDFLKLHYPCYWHYDILFGLKVMAEAGRIGDSRCREALRLLESKRLADGGLRAEGSYYRTGPKAKSRRSQVGWGGVTKGRMNEWVTLDALAVLKAAGRTPLEVGSDPE
ncbi:MAG: hypothetical protein ACRDHG_01450 [Anaerolineales bacterium]